MPSKTRIANKTIWALRDILDETAQASKHWGVAMDRAEKCMDITLINALARIRDELAVIERKAADALGGEYRQ